LDSAGSVGLYPTVTIGTDGLPLISYLGQSNGDLKIAHCIDTACSAATNVTLDSAGTTGLHTALTIGADGFALIAYYDQSKGDLKVAHCTNTFCTPYFRQR
jgi:hypothetical protein